MTIQIKRSLLALSVTAAITAPVTSFATNGMNMEGYGPISTAMGGAAMAYDNGVAAVMNNPATLGLMEDGDSRLDAALGNLSPDITSTHSMIPGSDTTSSADSFFMPAVGWATRDGDLTYGVGMAAQGGMGAEYDKNSFLAAGTGELVRSEVGVGRLIAPIVFNVDNNFTVGGSIDYVWVGMDLKMALAGSQFFDFVSTKNAGQASGGLVNSFGGMLTNNNTIAPTVNPDGSVTGAFNLYNARFDFSNNNDFTGEAKGNGFTGKIGFTYKINNNLSVGGTYHAKTSLSDLETSNATMSMTTDLTGPTTPPAGTPTAPIAVSGKISVNDFQWPSTIGFGAAYNQDKWMIAADVKLTQWSDVMDSFRMTFTADATQTGMAAGFAGQTMDVEMFQNWDDQTIIHLGGAYKVTPETTLRAGINKSSNPVPDEYLNPLFPATIETHYTFGVGHEFNKVSAVDFSLVMAPEVSVDAGSGVTTTHAQTNWQIMYSHNF